MTRIAAARCFDPRVVPSKEEAGLCLDDARRRYCFAVYVALLLYLNLPPPAPRRRRENGPLPRTVAAELEALGDLDRALTGGATFVLDERADRRRRRKRRRATGRPSAPAFVVETGRWLADVAMEAYYDVLPHNDGPTPGSCGPGDGARCALAPIAQLVVPGDDTYCLVARSARDARHVVVAFRGSASLNHLYTNADVRQRRLDLAARRRRRRRSSAGGGGLAADDESSSDEEEDDAAPAAPDGRGGLDLLVRSTAVVVGGVARGVDGLRQFTEGLVEASGAADVVPGLESLVAPCVHNGFWRAYPRPRRNRSARQPAAAPRLPILGRSMRIPETVHVDPADTSRLTVLGRSTWSGAATPRPRKIHAGPRGGAATPCPRTIHVEWRRDSPSSDDPCGSRGGAATPRPGTIHVEWRQL